MNAPNYTGLKSEIKDFVGNETSDDPHNAWRSTENLQA